MRGEAAIGSASRSEAATPIPTFDRGAWSIVHYISLGAGLVLILTLQATQWFFFDEWAFIELDGVGILEPHVGHWSTSPMLVYELLRGTIGLHSYLPYAALVTLIHLGVAHLIWRLALRSGASGWAATGLSAVLIVFGAGAENILWAFQIGFLGAVLLGLVSLLLATAPVVSWRRVVIIALISVLSLTWAGTAVPLVAATALVLWRRRGLAAGLAYLVPVASVYLVWYALFALHSPSNPDTGGFAAEKLFIQIPLFLGVMLVLGFSQILPVPGVAFALLAAVGVWLLVLARRRRVPARMLPALALAVAAAIFALLTAFSRASFSLGGGQASRYIYLLFALLLPLLAVALDAVVRWAGRRWVTAVLVAVVLSVIGYQAVLLVSAANRQAKAEQFSHGVLSAALELYDDDSQAVDLEARPDPVAAPDLTMRDLVRIDEAGLLPEDDEISAEELATARENLGLAPADG